MKRFYLPIIACIIIVSSFVFRESVEGGYTQVSSSYHKAGDATGNVVGPAVSVDNRVVFFDGLTGKLIKDSGILLSGSNTGDQTAIPNSTLATMATKTYKGRTAGTTGTPEDVAVATLKTDLVLVKGDVGLGNVDNTSDANKPVSSATQTALDLKVTGNIGITGATNTKITYDAKGLVTVGTAATTGDIADSTDKRYVTDANLIVIGNTSGTNTGDQTNITGNAATVTTNANLTGVVTSTGNATAIADAALSVAKTSGLQTALDAKAPLASPIFTTQITTPVVIGGTSPTQTITYKATTGVGATGADHIFLVGNNGSAEAVRITNDGNVGIGTSTPSVKLHIVESVSTVNTGLILGGSLNAENAGHSIDFRHANVNVSYARIAGVADSVGSAGELSLWTSSSISLAATEKVRIQGNGNVGIGTTTASAQFHTTGTVRFQNFGAGTATFDANGNVSSASDERLKNIDGTFDIGLNQILGVQPIKYHWNELSGLDRENQYVGFSAQNVRTYIPEAVSVNGEGYYGLQERSVIAALVNAVKELTSEIDALRAELKLPVFERLILDRISDAKGVVKSKVSVKEKQTNIGEVVTEVKLIKEMVKEIVEGVEIEKEVETLKTVIKEGIREKGGKYYREETQDEALARYETISQE